MYVTYVTFKKEQVMSNETLPPGMGRCVITGQIVPEDELVEINGQRVCAQGKAILLEKMKAGEAFGEPERPSAIMRFACSFIDGLVLTVPMCIGFCVFFRSIAHAGRGAGGGPMEGGVMNLVFFIMAITYFTLMHGLRGQTLGKMAGKIKVVRMDNKPMDLTTAFIRALGYYGPFILPPFLAILDVPFRVLQVIMFAGFAYYLADVIFALVDRTYQRSLHDRIAGTRVIKID